MRLLSAMTTVGGLTGISRIAGFVRDILTASILGAGPIADAFFVALKLPNFFRRVTAEGAFSVSFVPVYTEIQERNGQAEAHKFASNMFMVMLAILSIFCLAAIAFMPYIVTAVAPGFDNTSMRFELSVELARITFPYLLAMSIVALLGGVLNASGRFAPFAFAPVLFNISLIAALLSASHFQTAGHALAWGVAGAGGLQLLWLVICALRSGMRIQLKLPKLSAPVKKVGKLMLPGIVGAGVMHINLFADLIIASFFESGSISYLYYADRLNQLPLGVIGIAIGTALLPILSKAIASSEDDKARTLFNQALDYGLALAVPAAVGLATFAPLIISTLFERGAFTSVDSAKSAQILLCYVIGLPAYVMIKVFSTAHWAQQDTKTPVKIAVIATVTNIALSLIVIQFIGVAGIALATGVTGWLQVALHWRSLHGQKRFTFQPAFFKHTALIIGSSAIMAACAVAVEALLDTYSPILRLSAVITSAGAIYGLCLVGTGVIKIPRTFINKG